MLVRLSAAALVAITLAACNGDPADLPPLDRGAVELFAFGCADISGTYVVDANVRANQRAFHESFLRDMISASQNVTTPDQITIAGSARDSLIVTVWRSDSGDAGNREWRRLQDPAVRWSPEFARMSDADYAEQIAQLFLRNEATRVLHRGDEYDCGGGWVRSPRTVHDPGPDRNTPRPDTIIGEVLLSRAKDGGLLAMSEHTGSRQLTVWCGDGCRGIPLGISTVKQWTRWAKGEAHERPTDPRRWAVTRPMAPATPDEANRLSVNDISTRATACVTKGVSITTYERDGHAMLLSVSFTTQAAFAQFLKALRDDPVLAEPELKWVQTDVGGGGAATVRVSNSGEA